MSVKMPTKMQRYANDFVNVLVLCIYTRAEYLILDTVKVQCPPFSVVEVDRAGRESAALEYSEVGRGISLFEKHNKI